MIHLQNCVMCEFMVNGYVGRCRSSDSMRCPFAKSRHGDCRECGGCRTVDEMINLD